MTMTWNQFKERIDKALDDGGMSRDSELWYIYISFTDESRPPEILLDATCGIAVS